MHQFDPLAQALLEGHAYALEVAADHLARYKQPSTTMARAHLMRSALQAQILEEEVEGFSLVDSYLQFGRVEVVYDSAQTHFLLKARSALPIETSAQERWDFQETADTSGTEPLNLLLYAFGPAGLRLATVPAEPAHTNSRTRFILLGEIVEVGTWSAGDLSAFDQGADDSFPDLSEGVTILRSKNS